MIQNAARPASRAISQWREAAVSLETALNKYLELSISLNESVSPKDTPPKELVTEIDSALEWIQGTIVQKAFRVRATLAQMRNRALSPAYCLPHEVLSEIFTSVVFAPLELPPIAPHPLKTRLTHMYKGLYKLLGVCTVWRDVAFDYGLFWSIIPILDSPLRSPIFKTSSSVPIHILERSKGDLHLVATQACDSSCESTLVESAPRFRTVNISTNSLFTVRNILNIFLQENSPERVALSELSIYQDQENSYYDVLLHEEDNVFPLDSMEQHLLKKLVFNLSALRIRGAQLPWQMFNYCHRLTELHIQEVQFGYDTEVAGFISTLSSASELRVLKLISVRSFYDSALDNNIPQIQLPNLKTLLADDLYFNTLNVFLSSITSRSHSLILLLSGRSLYVRLRRIPRELEEVSWETLYELLRNALVRELLIAGDSIDPWPSPSPTALGELIKSVAPSLETLWMNSWNFDTAYSNILTHNSLSQQSQAPKLINLRITGAKVYNLESLVDMVASHSSSIQQVQLGLAIQDDGEDKWTPVKEDHLLVSRLKDVMPVCQIVDYRVYPLEFEDAPWQLW
ncbi:hypothetical protein RSOLAG1IB_09795 [Rhizoctonia solani AG-1 IB]|uniref:F-box domain-containing protein n=1 Tax=Thanatephorus cucumeris (strain AG1-IB / isolate 7/3/14) TaxID=1108050 RepID=A0A0B7FY44_THACB|nr:hypothetical protein RSOLAG1IB_09795 [Rhizoctonia solani AG-1 IB]